MNYPALPKRKRSDIEAQESRDSSFQLENLSNCSFLTFEPVSRLLRAHIPLSWLSSSSPHNLLPNGSVLQGFIDHVTSWEYAVLIARNIPNGGLYALEKVDQDVFVCQALQPFVTDKWIQDASIGAAPPVSLQMMLHYTPEPTSVVPKNHRRTPSLSSIPDFKVPRNRKGAAARLSILGQNASQETPFGSPISLAQDPEITIPENERDLGLGILEPTGQSEIASQIEPVVDSTAKTPVTDENVITQDMLAPEYLRQRYLEHLYKSNESIAYYTKGPLGRARARARAAGASMSSEDLANFYRESILPAKKMDLKFKESISHHIISSLNESKVESDEGTVKKKSARKKTKLGKDGLWPGEIEYVTKWWQTRSLKTVPKADQEAKIRDMISKSLRMREAQMQIVLMLEVLALESKICQTPLNEPGEAKPAGLNSVDTKAESIERDAPVPDVAKTEKRIKKRNLETDLEILADKLCIWHSLDVEFALFDQSDEVQDLHDENEEAELSRSQLRNFCADVLIPFYNSKVPLLCKSLCRTLAGPEVYEQAQKAARIKSGIIMKPGSQTLRSRPVSRSRTMDRVLSTEGVRELSPAPAFRSPTLPPVPSFKREPSEFSQRAPSRQNSVSFSNREIDLDADAQATAAKKRKLDRVASQKEELAAAIQALKKPHRQTLGKAYMDEVENRLTDRKQPILITATPRADRRKTLGDIPNGVTKVSTTMQDMVVPSSSVKPVSMPSTLSSSKKKAVLAAMQNGSLPEAGTKSGPKPFSHRLSAVRSTTAAVNHNDTEVLATPSKARTIDLRFSTPTKTIKSSSAGKENMFQLPTQAIKTMDRVMHMPVEDSIYDVLGWNDEEEN